MYTTTYYPHVLKRDIPRLDYLVKEKIKSVILQKLEKNPLLYGAPLYGILKPHWKFRVGDYRIIYRIVKNEIQIIAIGHRKEVYGLLERRT